MKKLMLLSLAAVCSVYAGGYKIPENSANALALSAANVAHSHGADAAYYNPANMPFMEDKNEMNVNLMYIGLDPIHFEGSNTMSGVAIDSKSETFVVPSIHYVSPKLGNARVGLSIVTPGGLSKRWNNSPAKDKAEEFTLQVVEVNPTMAISLSPKAALAFGFRIVHSSGVVKSTAAVSRDMTGESIDYGYNLAFSYKPTKNLDLALTYRSQVNLTVTGNAKLYNPAALAYDGGASVTVPLPACFNAAIAYTLPSKTTLEFVYDRIGWSAYKTLDFDYVGNIGNLKPYFDDPIAKNWNDTNAYRFGVTQDLDSLSIMGGIVYDETPVPDETLSFELPDSNSLSVSLGAKLKINDNLNAGLSALYSMRNKRSVTNSDLSGEFSNANVLLVSAGVEYKF